MGVEFKANRVEIATKTLQQKIILERPFGGKTLMFVVRSAVSCFHLKVVQIRAETAP